MKCKHSKEIKWRYSGNCVVITPRDIKTFITCIVSEHYDPKNKTLPLFTLLESPQVYNEYDWELRSVIKECRLSRDNPQMTVDEALYCVYRK